MNFVLHHLKTELQCDRAGIIIFLVSCLLWILSAVTILSGGSAWMAVTLSKLFFASGSVVLTGLSFYSGFRDSPLREEHFLDTRPLARVLIFTAKSIYALLLGLIFALSQVVLSSLLGLEHPAISHTIVVILWAQCALYLGAFISIHSSHVVWWSISGIAVTISIFLVAWPLQKTTYRFQDVSEIPLLVIILVALIAAFLVNALKAEKARRKFALIIAAGTLTMFAMSIGKPERTEMVPEDIFTETLAERPEIEMELVPRPGRKLRITPQFQSYVKGSPRVLSIYPHNLTITNSSGEELDIPKKITESFTVHYHGYQAEAVYPFMAFLDESVTGRLMEHRQNSHHQILNSTGLIVEIPESFAAVDEEITIAYEPRLRLKVLEKLGSMPYEKGATVRNSRFIMTVNDSEIINPNRGTEQSYSKSSFVFHWASEEQNDLHSVFINPNGEHPWMHRIRGHSEVEFTGHSIAGTRNFSAHDSRLHGQKYEAYPAGAEILLFEMKDVGERAFPRMSRTVTPRRLFGLKPAPVARPSHVLQPTTKRHLGKVSRLENGNVSDFLKAIGRHSYSEIRDNKIIRATIDDLSRKTPNELLDYLAKPLSQSSVRSHIIRSLTLYGPESIKERALNLLKQDPDLISLVMARGWGEEARPLIEEIAHGMNRGDRYDTRRSLIYYNDNKSLDRLLEIFEEAPVLETYNALYASEEHRDRLKKIYRPLEEEFIDKVQRAIRPDELNQSETILFLKTGSTKSLKAYAKKIIKTHHEKKIGGGINWVLTQCILTADYAPPGYDQDVVQSIFRQIAELPNEQLRYDVERQRFILPALNNN